MADTPLTIIDEPQADLLLMKKLIQLSNDPFRGVALAGDDPARLLGWKRERDEARDENAALRDYVQHKHDCLSTGIDLARGLECTCGLAALLREEKDG